MSEESESDADDSRYAMREEIGRGAMGVVLRVVDRDLDRELAMKRELVQSSDGEALHREAEFSTHDVERQARFIEEAYVTAQLDHPGIVPVIDLGTDTEGHSYYTMKLVDGVELGSLFRMAKDGVEGWSLPRALGVLIKVCQAVGYAHSKGVVHRDLKPSNVMVGTLGEVYVMDWGLAKMTGREDLRNLRLELEGDGEDDIEIVESVRTERGGSLMTMDGAVVGTPAYMPPEQAKGQIAEVDQRSDLYAIGAMLYELLTGHPPYLPTGSRLTPREVVTAINESPPERVLARVSSSPAELVSICEKAMARRKEDRYDSVLVLAEDLQAYLDDRVVSAHKTGTLAEARKWVLRNRLTAWIGMIALLLTIGGLIAIAVVQTTARKEIADSLDRESEAKDEALNTLAFAFSNSGDAAAQAGDDARALLWFSKASTIASAPEAQLAHRVRAQSWAGHPFRVVRALKLDPGATDFEVHSTGRYLLAKGNHGCQGADLETEELLHLGKSSQSVLRASWNSAGTQIAIQEKGSPVRIETFPERTALFEVPGSKAWGAQVIAFSADNQWLAIGGRRGISVWSTSTWNVLWEDEQVKVRELTFSPSEHALAVVTAAGELIYFELPGERGAARERWRGKAGNLNVGDRRAMKFGFTTEGGGLVGRQTSRSEITWWKISSGEIYRVDRGIHAPSALSPNGRWLVCMDYGRPFRSKVIDVLSGEVVSEEDIKDLGLGLAFLNHDRFVVLNDHSGLSLFSEIGKKERLIAVSRATALTRIVASPEGDWLGVLQEDGVFRVLAVPPARPQLRTVSGLSIPNCRLVLNQDGTLVAPAGTIDSNSVARATGVYRVADGKAVSPRLELKGPLLAAVFSVDSRYLVTASAAAVQKERAKTMHLSEGKSGRVSIWNWGADEMESREVQMPSEPVSLAVHPTRPDEVAVLCAGGQVELISLGTTERKPLFKIRAFNPMALYSKERNLAFSPSGDFLVLWGTREALVTVWNVGKGQYQFPPLSTSLDRHVSAASLGRDPETGQEILATVTVGSRDGMEHVQVWDLSEGRELGPLQIQPGWVLDCDLSTDGKLLLFGGARGVARVLDWRTGQPVGPDFRHGAPVSCVRFVPGTTWVISGDQSGQLETWNPQTGRRVTPRVTKVGKEFYDLKVAPNGRTALTSLYGYSDLYLLDLEEIHEGEQTELQREDALESAELGAGAEFYRGGLVDLTGTKWLKRWRQFRKKHPQYHHLPQRSSEN